MLREGRYSDYVRHPVNRKERVEWAMLYKRPLEAGEPDAETCALEAVKLRLDGSSPRLDRNDREHVQTVARRERVAEA
jgi:hypothetical protein